MQALFDLEATNAELKSDLRDLYITSAKEVDVSGGARKAIIITVRATGQAAGLRLAVPTVRPAAGTGSTSAAARSHMNMPCVDAMHAWVHGVRSRLLA